LDDADSDKIDPVSGVWLPTDESEDASLTHSMVQSDCSWTPHWIVVDHYGLSASWHQQMRLFWPSVLIAAIDDLADRSLDPDLLIDHNFSQENLFDLYKLRISSSRDIGFCFGPEFALIDPFFSGFHGSLPPRRKLRRLLISLGGAGDSQLLVNILNALKNISFLEFDIQLIQGGFAQDSTEIQRLSDQLQIQRFSDLPSLAPLMAAADVAIGAGGTTTWERLCLGLPSITYALADNQKHFSKALGDCGLIEYMGSAHEFDASRLNKALLGFCSDPNRLYKQSSLGIDLVDGLGCERIARLISASVEPQLWEKVVHYQSDSKNIFSWPDGLQLSNPGPLRCLDLLQVNRRRPQPSSAFLRSTGNISPDGAGIQSVSIVSSSDTWMNQYIPLLIDQALQIGCAIRWVHDHRSLQPGDVCFLLSYGRIVSKDWLLLHRNNLVVHASDLPHGKGWSPMTWQILDEATAIPLTLFEASSDLDSGPIYCQKLLELQGYELAPEWQRLQAESTIELCLNWLKSYPDSLASVLQSGTESFYERRRPEDSRLSTELSLRELFPLLQVVDNQAYPAFFELKGRRFRFSIDSWPT